MTDEDKVLLEWGLEAMERALFWVDRSAEVTIDKLEKCIGRYREVLDKPAQEIKEWGQ